MAKQVCIFLIFFFSTSTMSMVKDEANLEKLLEQIKKNRINDAAHKLPNGVYWAEGYYVSGKFYLCSKNYSLYLNNGANKEYLDTLDVEINHVEMTISNSSGSVTILEIHNVIEGRKLGCQFKNEAT